MKKNLLIIFICTFAHSHICTFAQDDLMNMIDSGTPSKEPVIATFKTTRIINAHSIETVKKKTLDVRITHRFGNMADSFANIHTGYGLYQIQDIRIAFEYGITNELTIGLGKSKFNWIEPVDGYLKYRLLQQTTDNKIPIALTIVSTAAVAGVKANTDSTSEFSYPDKFVSRLSYVTQILVARKFGNVLSLELIPTYVYRNYVGYDDKNGFFSIGIGGRLRISKSASIIADYFYIPNNHRKVFIPNTYSQSFYKYFNPLAVGLELETGGHVFHITFTNSTGIIENAYLPYTMSSWLKGEFRWGFNISRVFALGK